MKGTVWLMQEKKKRWFLKFFCKKSSIWWALPGGSLGKDWVQWRGCQNKIIPAGGVVSWEATWVEIWAKEIPISISKDLMGHEGKPGSWWRRTEAWEDRTKTREPFQRWKGGVLKGSAERRHSLSGRTSPIKMPRDTGGQVHGLLHSWGCWRRLL